MRQARPRGSDTAYERILDALRDHGSTVTEQRSGDAMAQCPSHPDGRPSLHITDGDDRALVWCFAECAADDIMAALGMTRDDLFNAESTNYDYRNDSGATHRTVTRRPGKRIFQSGETGKGTAILFRLPEVREAIRQGQRVVLVEGEPDALAVSRRGQCGTTAPAGAANFRHCDITPLTGANVIAVVDNDEAGDVWAAQVQDMVGEVAEQLHFVKAKVGKDASDHFAAGYDFRDFVDYTPPDPLLDLIKGGRWLDQQEFPTLAWMVPDLIPEGFGLLTGPPKVGKQQPLDTPVLTPSGWATIGELRVGDQVYGSDGKPTTVVALSPIDDTEDCFEVQTRSGAITRAGRRHLWQVHQRGVTKVVTTEELSKGYQGRRWLLPVAEPLDLPAQNLPLDPWVLGYWLGNGTTSNGGLTAGNGGGDEDWPHVAAHLDRANYSVTSTHVRRPGTVQAKSSTLINLLRGAGLLGNKHVPEGYLLGSQQQRRDLLAGLLDSDGYAITAPNGSGLVEFTSITKNLAEGVLFLARSLGFKATMSEGVATLEGRDMGPKYRITFAASRSDGVFTFARKRDALPDRPRSQRAHRDAIVSVAPVPSVPMRCITVSNPDGLYLTGRDLMVTHNSYAVLGMALSAAMGGKALGRIPVERKPVLYLALEDGDRRMQARCRSILQGEPIPDGFQYITEAPEGSLFLLIERWIQRNRSRHPVVILDTLGKVMPSAKAGESQYQRDYRIGGALKQLAGPGITVMVVHHTNKTESSDWMNSTSGTNGLNGAADWTLNMARDRNSPNGIFRVTGRDVDEGEYGVVFASGSWYLDGNDLTQAEEAAQVLLESKRGPRRNGGDLGRKITETLGQYDEGVGPGVLGMVLGVNRIQLLAELQRLVDSGVVRRDGAGSYELTTRRAGPEPGAGDGAPVCFRHNVPITPGAGCPECMKVTE